jgi:dTDP-4-dehydrorhamnose 3,5-epimerase
MHFQRPPYEEAKIVRCVRGMIFDVVVDLRVGSPTQGAWFGSELDAASGSALYVPEGCAHGFQTLVDDADVLYLISQSYVPEASAGVRWDDPAFGIEWPDSALRTINERDRNWPDFELV